MLGILQKYHVENTLWELPFTKVVRGRSFTHNEVAPGSQNFSAILIVGGKASENSMLNTDFNLSDGCFGTDII